jgi:hypothetical protein
MVTKRHALLCLAIVAGAACSSSTSPSGNNSGGEKPPSSAGNGDKVNLSGTYNLSTLTIDSTDGGSASATTDANDGATLTLTTTAYTLATTGNFSQSLSNTSGSYTATDTSSSAQRGTLVLTDSAAAKTENAMYGYANNTLTVTIPNGDGSGNTVVTAWVKQ